MGKNGNRVSPLALLTPQQVREIRRLIKDGVTQHEIARRFAISQPTVSNIVAGKVYKRVS